MNLKVAILFILAVIFVSCKDKQNETVAEVYGVELKRAELSSLFSGNETKEDSILISKKHINHWVEEQISIYEAKNNKDINALEIALKAENYENTLLVHKDENLYIQINLDTLIRKEQYLEYYNKNKKDFYLNDYLVKVFYLKVSIDAPDINLVDRWYLLRKEDDINSIEEYAKSYGENFYYNIDTWMYFDQLEKEIPLQDINKDAFITRKRSRKIHKNDYYYYINILDYKLKNSSSPIEFEKKNIKVRILNERINELRKNYKNIIIQKAENEKAIKIY